MGIDLVNSARGTIPTAGVHLEVETRALWYWSDDVTLGSMKHSANVGRVG